MKCYWIIFLFILSAIWSCTPAALDRDDYRSYLPLAPSESYTIVNKYYSHYWLGEAARRRTDMEYVKYERDQRVLTVTRYNAAFEKLNVSEILLMDDRALLKKEKSYTSHVSDSFALTENSMYINKDYDVWLSLASSSLRKELEFNGYQNRIHDNHTSTIDTIVDNIPGKFFSGTRELIYVYEKDTTTVQYDWTKTMGLGLGEMEYTLSTSDWRIHKQLDRTMSLEEFEALADHDMHRVAYIDPDKTMDSDTSFQTCHHIYHIADYYNSSEGGLRLEGGKGRLQSILDRQLDSNLLKNQNGYLTFRFVMNCEGKAGRFITEECNFNYEKYSFSDPLKNQLLSILQSIDKWKPIKLKNEWRDSYNYITFKIANNEIVDILP